MYASCFVALWHCSFALARSSASRKNPFRPHLSALFPNGRFLGKTAGYVRSALSLMSQYNISITPRVYAVWYDYGSGKSKELREAIDAMLDSTDTNVEICTGEITGSGGRDNGVTEDLRQT